ncbi:MAG: electron transport complex subunit RsxG [Ectothiorhodospiraceae bacterium]|jgi:electron transport complex protein RnfG
MGILPEKPAIRQSLIATVVLAAFAIAGTSLVALTHRLTLQRIAENRAEVVRERLSGILPRNAYDNKIVADRITVHAPSALGSDEPLPVYRARRGGHPVAAILTVVAPDGYNGPIRLLVGISRDGTILGVRVVAHQETPGLGDRIEAEKSDWIRQFENKSLSTPAPENWAVARDGGAFDQLTGATITPRAVVKAVHKALLYFRDHREALFRRSAEEQS